MASILLVDDDEPTRRLLEVLLLDLGEHEIEHASEGGEALTKLRDYAVDLVILDMRLPDMDGLAVYREARDEGYAGMVLILTASSPGDPLVEQVETEVGPQSLLLKPFDVDELAARIKALLNGLRPVAL